MDTWNAAVNLVSSSTSLDSGTKSRLSSKGGWETFGISVWDKVENPEAYNRDKYPEVTKSLATAVKPFR